MDEEEVLTEAPPEDGANGSSASEVLQSNPPADEEAPLATSSTIQEVSAEGQGDEDVPPQQEATPQAVAVGDPDEPPQDWLEPLDEDDFDEDEEVQSGSLEGSMSGSRGGGGRGNRGGYKRRSRNKNEEEWDDWPILGEGWKRREVMRRSGTQAGKSDTYYMGPRGERARSKVELAKYLSSTMDLDSFDFKSGTFHASPRKRQRAPKAAPEKRRPERSPSEDTAVSDDSSYAPDETQSYSSSHSSVHRAPIGGRGGSASALPDPAMAPLSVPSSPEPSPLPNVSVPRGPPAANAPSRRVCVKCATAFTTFNQDQDRCEACNVKMRGKDKAFRAFHFRKWIPCGKCTACLTTEDCGVCASCMKSKAIPGKPARCRKRKCLCPYRKTPYQPEVERASRAFLDDMLFESEILKPRKRPPSPQDSDTDEYGQFDDDDDDDDEEDDDDDDDDTRSDIKKRKRRTCGKCEGCNVRTDCGTCDFCVDKPKFGGSNKKRQKCRLRQCTRQAMLGENEEAGRGVKRRRKGKSWEFEFSDNENEASSSTATTTRTIKTYSRKEVEAQKKPSLLNLPTQGTSQMIIAVPGNPQLTRVSSSSTYQIGIVRKETETPRPLQVPTSSTLIAYQATAAKPLPVAIESRKKEETIGRSLGARESASSNGDGVGRREVVEDDNDGFPVITQLYCMGDSGVDLDGELLSLLEGLRASALPQLWLPVLREGPQIQVLQCSKLSPMADTAVLVGPGLGYSVTVQDQPLVPTHSIYGRHPTRLVTPSDVLALLRDLEEHAVCQGVRTHASAPPNEPLVNVRLATCEFLVPRSRVRCSKCRYPEEDKA